MSSNILSKIQNLNIDEKQELLGLLEELELSKSRDACAESFLHYVKQIWAAFIHGKHHEIMAEACERVASGE